MYYILDYRPTQNLLLLKAFFARFIFSLILLFEHFFARLSESERKKMVGRFGRRRGKSDLASKCVYINGV